MKKTFLFVATLSVFSFLLKAQEYKTAVGIRLGPNSPAISPGFTIKHFLDEQHAVEGMVGLTDGIGVCALYEWHHPITSVEHLQWFVGAGGYAATEKTPYLPGKAAMPGIKKTLLILARRALLE